ncbi:uncharacterized protein CG5098 isoform X2 [Anthonomus grandis grandis]|uniref:uncharacterized protein CG5098 isoform X2 n=1 Tax=Anthonomus grandis grandis TaxID=2921223 RepID=UPI0021662F9F|nr:uncharacterized protein CG5098 isoform X2 [Anthonomus grandis grandis]
MSGGGHPPHHPHNRHVPPANSAWNHLSVPGFFPRQPQVAHMQAEHSLLHQPSWHTPTTNEAIKMMPHAQMLNEMFKNETLFPRDCVDLSLTRNGQNQNGEMLSTPSALSLSVRDASKINSLASGMLDIQAMELTKCANPNLKSTISPGSIRTSTISPGLKSASPGLMAATGPGMKSLSPGRKSLSPAPKSASPGLNLASGVLPGIFPGVSATLSNAETGKNQKRSNIRVDSILERLNPPPEKTFPYSQEQKHDYPVSLPSTIAAASEKAQQEKLHSQTQSVIVSTATNYDENSNSSSTNVPTPKEEDSGSMHSNEDSLDSTKSRRKRKPSKTVRVNKEDDLKSDKEQSSTTPPLQDPTASNHSQEPTDLTPQPRPIVSNHLPKSDVANHSSDPASIATILEGGEAKSADEVQLDDTPSPDELDAILPAKTRRKTSSESETIDDIAAMVQEGLKEKQEKAGGGGSRAGEESGSGVSEIVGEKCPDTPKLMLVENQEEILPLLKPEKVSTSNEICESDANAKHERIEILAVPNAEPNLRSDHKDESSTELTDSTKNVDEIMDIQTTDTVTTVDTSKDLAMDLKDTVNGTTDTVDGSTDVVDGIINALDGMNDIVDRNSDSAKDGTTNLVDGNKAEKEPVELKEKEAPRSLPNASPKPVTVSVIKSKDHLEETLSSGAESTSTVDNISTPQSSNLSSALLPPNTTPLITPAQKKASNTHFVEVENKLEEMFAGIVEDVEPTSSPVSLHTTKNDSTLGLTDDSFVKLEDSDNSSSKLDAKNLKLEDGCSAAEKNAPKEEPPPVDVKAEEEEEKAKKHQPVDKKSNSTGKKVGKKANFGVPVKRDSDQEMEVPNKKKKLSKGKQVATSINTTPKKTLKLPVDVPLKSPKKTTSVTPSKGTVKATISESIKDVYAYDSSSNASSSKSRGPFVQIRGPRDSPVSVNIVNTPLAVDDETKPVKNKKFHDDSEYRHKVRSKGLHCSTLSNKYDAERKDASWICAFCKRGPHASELTGPTVISDVPAPGDLFGPYFITSQCPEFQKRLDDPFDRQFKSRKISKALDAAALNSAKSLKKTKRKSESSSDPVDAQLGITPTDQKTYEIWTHEDCLVWSPGVYLVGPKILGLEEAVWTCSTMSCKLCGLKGANVNCGKRGCLETAHLGCSRRDHWALDEGTFKAYCPDHAR